MKHIAVFCSANEAKNMYTKPAKEFARLLVKHKYHLIWGGSDSGLMKTVASEVQAAGGKIIGISMELLRHAARKNADEMVTAKDLGERKKTMLRRADAFVLLVGGLGTLDEITEILELKKHGLHSKPVVVLNTENFYSGLKAQLKKMKDEGFLTKPLPELLYFAVTPQEAIDYINNSLT